MGKPKPETVGRKDAKATIAKQLKRAKDTPVGNLGISTDDALEAIRKGQEGN